MKLLSLFILVFNLSLGLTAQNILISNTNSPCEPAICISPYDTNLIVAGSVLNQIHYSHDGGVTWNNQLIYSSLGVWGDPVIDIDTNGNFYFFHLSNPLNGTWIDRIVCQKSTDNGVTWNDGTATGKNGNKAQDKHWSVVDRTTNAIYLTWTEFDSYGSSHPNDSSRILFSKSFDQGATWSNPVKVNTMSGNCVDSSLTVEGAVPAVGPNGEVYISWAGPNGIVLKKSTNQGDSWPVIETLIDSMPGGWDIKIPGFGRANGFPVIKCDLSNGSNRGTIYVNWADQRNGIENTDIWLSKSIDGGETWSSPNRVNNDSSNHHQFFTWMDIDQTNGNLYFVFYDRRNHENIATDVYLATSFDGGETFENYKISESPFFPDSNIFMGDYNNISAHNNVVRPIWTRADNGKTSVWTHIVDIETPEPLIIPEIQLLVDAVEIYPNPTTSIHYVKFKLREESTVSLSLYNIQGHMVSQVVQNELTLAGKHVLSLNAQELNLRKGIYFYQLTINNQPPIHKKLVVK